MFKKMYGFVVPNKSKGHEKQTWQPASQVVSLATVFWLSRNALFF